MFMRELTDGEVAAYRQKALTKVDASMKALEGKTDREKFNVFAARHEEILDKTKRASENLDHDKFLERGNDKLSPECLEMLAKAAVEGFYHAEEIRRRMATLKDEDGRPLAKVNGTSEIFRRCTQSSKTEKDCIKNGIQFVTTGKLPQKIILRSEQPCLQTMKVMLGQFFTACMILPDMIERAMV